MSTSSNKEKKVGQKIMPESKQLNVTPNDKEIMKQMLSGYLSLEFIGIHIVKYNKLECIVE